MPSNLFSCFNFNFGRPHKTAKLTNIICLLFKERKESAKEKMKAHANNEHLFAFFAFFRYIMNESAAFSSNSTNQTIRERNDTDQVERSFMDKYLVLQQNKSTDRKTERVKSVRKRNIQCMRKSYKREKC